MLLLIALAACSKQEQAAAPTASTPAATPAADTTAAPAAPAANVTAMSAEQLREAATKALSDNRIYSPGGDNALEYYLAARDKQPDNPAVTSALTDLLPYTVIAAEQSIAREDFAEAQRLSALIERTDPRAPSLPRLKQTIASAQQAASRRSVEEAAKAQELAKKQEEQRKAQQAEQQRKAAEALAAQQEEARTRAAEQAAAQQREREAAARTAAPAQTTPASPATAAPEPPTLRAISMPSPRYPAEAQRAGTAGEVMVELTVGTDGSVTNARVVRSNPPRIFDREALSAVRRWKFAPIPQPTTTRRTINFTPGG
ncbi:energy transducer TonB [Pseudoxanthomonas sangjuensis]